MRISSLRDPDSQIQDEDKYPALRVLMMLWKIASVLCVVAALFVGIGFGFLNGNKSEPAQGMAVILVGTIAGITLWAQAEIVQVLIDIEENTRRR